MREVTATVVFAVDITTNVGIDSSPGALREMILLEAERQVRSSPPFNSPIIVKCSDPEMEEHKRFLKLGRGQKTLPIAVTVPNKSAPSRNGAKIKGSKWER